uniref:CCHC-type domain-containing protein n=1 Tax=Oryctolagus cuniculus TaxID=9986 RepID=G1U0R9_RABIT
MSNKECFKCGRSGHWARGCPRKEARSQGSRGRGRAIPGTSAMQADICYRCGESGHHAKNCDLNCYRCGEFGHLARECDNEMASD